MHSVFAFDLEITLEGSGCILIAAEDEATALQLAQAEAKRIQGHHSRSVVLVHPDTGDTNTGKRIPFLTSEKEGLLFEYTHYW